MRFRIPVLILVAALAVIGGAQLRIATIVIEERSGPRTVFRICLPGRTPDVFAMTERDFMCRIYDRYGLRELDGGFGRATETVVSPTWAASPILPDERDRQVLETALLRLLTDSEFNMAGIAEKEATIVLNVRSPEKTGMIRRDQMAHDIGKGHSIPGDIQIDLLRRNEKPGTYDSQLASFGELKFDERVVVTNVTAILEGDRFGRAFKQAHPNARAWVKAWLPGYSEDATKAVVRAWIGPSHHGAVITMLLEKKGDEWMIKWHHLARFV